MISISTFFSKKHISFKIILNIFIIALCFFSCNNLSYAKSDLPKELIPLGNIIQIDAELDSVLVKGNTSSTPFKPGDLIISIDNLNITDIRHYINTIKTISSDKNIDVVIKRGEKESLIKATKKDLISISCDDFISGFATLTYLDPDTNKFGAVGHPISIDKSILPIKNGFVSITNNLKIEKSYSGFVGSLRGDKLISVGNFTSNKDFGINGKITSSSFDSLKSYPVAEFDEIQIGTAYAILQDELWNQTYYEINIINISCLFN